MAVATTGKPKSAVIRSSDGGRTRFILLALNAFDTRRECGIAIEWLLQSYSSGEKILAPLKGDGQVAAIEGWSRSAQVKGTN
ncbi:MAG: hypothetical protein WA750_08165 [Pseudolabrys sp.]